MNVTSRFAALTIAAATMALPLHAQFGISVNVGFARTPPPELPVYDQPEAPGDGYLWTPGYWAWDDEVADYYWVPGTWVMAPEPGLLWTPGYWASDNGGYAWRAGYWGQHVGFYGGVNYGFGYFGTGYEGGYWNGDRFFYNSAVNRINVGFMRNVYSRPVRPEWNVRGPRPAFNGPGGINARPSRGEDMAFRENHFEPTGFQRNQANFARQDRGQFAGYNHGAPPAAATARPVQNANGFRNGAAPAQGAPTGVADWNRNRGNDNRGNGIGDNRGGYNDNRGGQNNDRGGQNNDPRNGFNGNGNNGGSNNGYRNGFNGNGAAPVQNNPAQAAPAQPNAPQNTNRGGWNGPGDGRYRPQPPMTPRMLMPENGNGGGGRTNGGQPTQSQPAPTQPAPTQPTQGRPTGGGNGGGYNGGGRNGGAQPTQTQPTQAQPAPAQPTQGRPAGGGNGGNNNGGGGRPTQPQGAQPTSTPPANNGAQNQNRPAPSGMRQFERLH